MNKIKKIVLILLVMSLIVNPMYLTLRVHAVNEELAMSRISDALQSIMKNSSDENIEIIIWLNDINISSAVLSSSDEVLSNAKSTLLSRGLCEISTTDAEIYSQYMSERKEAMVNHYTAYTRDFAASFLLNNEIVYLSAYSPVIIASLNKSRINTVAKSSYVRSMDFYCDDVEEIVECDSEAYTSLSTTSNSSGYYEMNYIKQYLGINGLINYVGANGDGIKIGVLDYGQPNIAYLRSIGLDDNLQMNSHVWYATEDRHPKRVLEIIHSIIPDAEFYYTTFFNVTDGQTYTLIEEMEWLLSKNVDIINCSLHLGSQSSQGAYDTYSSYGNIADYLDYISSEYGVTIVKSAGNWKPNEEEVYIQYGVSSGGMAYNVITVGDYNLNTQALNGTSEYYLGDVWTNKPDLCAPGSIQFLDLSGDYGTSYSAPIVAGISGLIVSYYNSLILPFEVKSILCASCGQHKYSFDSDNFKKYGAGVVDAWYVKQIISSDQQVRGSFESNEQVHTYYFYLEDEDYTLIDIVLTFEKSYYEDLGLNIGDIDLYLYDSEYELIASSNSDKNNLEVLVDFTLDYDPLILEVRQTQSIYDNNPSFTDDISFVYSLAWMIHE